jgi:hypothetical protein
MEGSSDLREDKGPPGIGIGRLAALGVLLVAACGEPETPAPAEEPARLEQPSPAEPLPGAVYRTSLTFVGQARDPSLLQLRFDSRTDSVSIALRYRGWFGGSEWRPILDHSDTLPVPRAAWRVLPTGPVRILAGEGGEVSSVILDLPEGSLRLDSRGAIGSWNSRTGQRESLRLAELLDDSGAESGLLLARQSAHGVDDALAERTGQAFLVSDTAGNAILLMRDSAAPDAPVTAWTWFEDTETEWNDALILTLAATGESPGRWSFELPEAGLLGELRGLPGGPMVGAEDGAGFQTFRVEASLVLDGQSWTMNGIGLLERVR